MSCRKLRISSGIRSMDIYSLWCVEQHLKDYKKRYNDYKPKKAYVKFIQSKLLTTDAR